MPKLKFSYVTMPAIVQDVNGDKTFELTEKEYKFLANARWAWKRSQEMLKQKYEEQLAEEKRQGAKNK